MNRVKFKMRRLAGVVFGLLMSGLVMAGAPDQEVRKTIEKSYDVASDASLEVSNEYGNINITTWDKPRIDIQVTVIAKGDDRSYLGERVDEVKLYFDSSPKRVSAKTEIGKQSWWSWIWGYEARLEVNYAISMPVTGSVELTNDYGDITIDVLEGNADINCDYGNLHLGELRGRSDINLDYSPGSTIEYAHRLDMNTDYSKVRIENSRRLELNADYCTLEIGEVERMEFNGDYGALDLGSVDELDVNADYLSLSIERLERKMNYKGDYGSLKIREIGPNFTNMDLKADYVSISMGIHPDAAFNIRGEESYTTLKFDREVRLSEGAGKGLSSDYTGAFGEAADSSSLMNLNTSYGKIRMYVN